MVFDNKGKEKKDAIWSVRDCRKVKPDTTNGEVGEKSSQIFLEENFGLPKFSRRNLARDFSTQAIE